MKRKMNTAVSVAAAAAMTAVSVFAVAFLVLYKPGSGTPAEVTVSNVEYAPPAHETECILITCSDCGSSAVLLLDFEEQDARMTLFDGPYPEDYGFEITGKLTVNSSVIAALADSAGGLDFTLEKDTSVLEKGSWRLTGSQTAALIHTGDEQLKEGIIAKFFSIIFASGLQNNQISIILESGTDIPYSQLYDIARFSKDWLSQITVSK